MWAKRKADEKFFLGDFEGAMECARVAKQICFDLGGIDHTISALEVHIADTKKNIDSEMDWHGILGVDASLDVEAMKKQYKKRAILIHPDKNKSVGAEGAFKILLEAWTVLSASFHRGESSNQQSAHTGATEMCPKCNTDRQSGPAKLAKPTTSAQSATSESQSATGPMATCPKCKAMCRFKTASCSSITCSSCGRRFVFKTGRSRTGATSGPNISSGPDCCVY